MESVFNEEHHLQPFTFLNHRVMVMRMTTRSGLTGKVTTTLCVVRMKDSGDNTRGPGPMPDGRGLVSNARLISTKMSAFSNNEAFSSHVRLHSVFSQSYSKSL